MAWATTSFGDGVKLIFLPKLFRSHVITLSQIHSRLTLQSMLGLSMKDWTPEKHYFDMFSVFRLLSRCCQRPWFSTVSLHQRAMAGDQNLCEMIRTLLTACSMMVGNLQPILIHYTIIRHCWHRWVLWVFLQFHDAWFWLAKPTFTRTAQNLLVFLCICWIHLKSFFAEVSRDTLFAFCFGTLKILGGDTFKWFPLEFSDIRHH